MNGAKLWKRILNEGFQGDYIFDGDANWRITKDVITSPIIVDSRPLQSVSGWNSLFGMVLPFAKFWLEGPISGGDVPKHIVDPRWGVLIESSVENEQTKVIGHCFFSTGSMMAKLEGAFIFWMNKSGKPVGNPEAHMNEDVIESRKRLGFNAESGVGGIMGMACDILLFIGCKNIDLQSHDNDPKQVRRAIKRHGGTRDSYRYHTLVVRPAGSKPGTPGQDIGIMPRHVCRGHFAEYGPEFNKGLLFGKYAGRFYVPPHMKGKNENGTVEKDYMVSA